MPFPDRHVFNLASINRFNPALIYGFDHEKSTRTLSMLDVFLHGANQYRDMFDAYHYAENEILLLVDRHGIEHINPELFLEWLHQIHLRISRTLAVDSQHPELAGSYTNRRVTRWHLNESFGSLLVIYLSEAAVENKKSILKELFSMGLAKNISIAKVTALIRLFEGIRADSTITLSSELLQEYNPDSRIATGIKTLIKLFALHDMNQLTAEQQQLISTFVTICMKPSSIPDAARKFACEIVAAWKTCDGSLNQVAELAHRMFFGITELHPYFNANGRTATCMMNIFIVSQRFPSILVRLPSETRDPNSRYSIAIEKMNSQPELIEQHIKQRIEETQQNGAYNDATTSAIITRRVEVSTLLEKIKKEFSNYNLEAYYDNIIYYTGTKFDLKEPLQLLEGLKTLISGLMILHNDLVENTAVVIAPTLSVVKRKYTQQEIEIIETKLKQLSGHLHWKYYQKDNGYNALLILPSNQVKQAQQLAAALQETGAVQAVFNTEKHGEKRPVVQVTNVNLNKLNAIRSLKGVVIEPQLTAKQSKPA